MDKASFSILERIVVVETLVLSAGQVISPVLSVSSNGSWWLKHARIVLIDALVRRSFSILERIVVVETRGGVWTATRR